MSDPQDILIPCRDTGWHRWVWLAKVFLMPGSCVSMDYMMRRAESVPVPAEQQPLLLQAVRDAGAGGVSFSEFQDRWATMFEDEARTLEPFQSVCLRYLIGRQLGIPLQSDNSWGAATMLHGAEGLPDLCRWADSLRRRWEGSEVTPATRPPGTGREVIALTLGNATAEPSSAQPESPAAREARVRQEVAVLRQVWSLRRGFRRAAAKTRYFEWALYFAACVAAYAGLGALVADAGPRALLALAGAAFAWWSARPLSAWLGRRQRTSFRHSLGTLSPADRVALLAGEAEWGSAGVRALAEPLLRELQGLGSEVAPAASPGGSGREGRPS